MLSTTYKAHAVWAVLKQVEDQLQGFTDKTDQRFADLQKKAIFLRWILEKSDPTLLSTQDLTNIQNQLQQVISHIPNNANNWAHHPHIEGFFSQAFQIAPYPRIQKLFKTDVNAFIDNCADRVDRFIDDTAAKVAEELETSEGKLDAFDERRQTFLAEIAASKTRTEDIDNSLVNLEAKVDAQFENWETRLDTEIKEKLGELSETFTNSQSKRSKEHESLLNEIADALRKAQSNTDSTLAANKKQLSEAKQNLKEMGEEITSEAKGVLAEINKIYGIAGNNALSGDFAKTAKEENNSYVLFNRFASFFYILIPASLMYLWYDLLGSGELSLSNLLFRLPISFVFLAPAIYFGNLAQKHRRVSIAFRSLGMRIATFDAYLATFDTAEKNTEKTKMASVFFDAKISSDRRSDTTYKDVGKALDQMTEPLEKISKVFAGKSS